MLIQWKLLMKELDQELGGAKVPDVTQHFSEVISAALMVPMGEHGPNDPYCQMGLPCVFWGLSGIAKSDKVRQGAARVGLPLRVIYPSQKQPEDFGDLPVVIDREGTGKQQLVSACMLSAVNELNALAAGGGAGGVVFFDEISCAPPAVQAPMLGVILENMVGATPIHPAVRKMAAANPPDYAAGGYSLEPPLANRMAHFAVRCPSVEEWSDYLMAGAAQNLTRIDGPLQMLRVNWNDQWSSIRGHLINFMRANRDRLHEQPTPDNPQSSYCWPSPRTWVMAGKSVATVRCLGMDPRLEQYLVEACVGLGAAQEWQTFLANADLPNPRDVLINGWPIDKTRLDKVMAVFHSVTSLVLGVANPQEKFQMATLEWMRLQDLLNAGMLDIAAKYAQTLTRNNLGFGKAAPDALKKAAKPVLLALGDTESGLMEYLRDH